MRYLISGQTSLFQEINTEYQHSSIEDMFKYFSDIKDIGLDIETGGFDPYTKKIISIQIGDDVNQYFIDLNIIDISLLKSFLEDESKLFILHNGKFDLRFFLHNRIVIKNIYDTFICETLLYNGYPYGVHPRGLKDCVERYFGKHLDKSVRGRIIYTALNTEIIIYGCEDVEFLVPLMENQKQQAIDKELLNAFDIENAFVPVLAYIEYCGIKLDETKWKEKMKIDETNLNLSKRKLDEWVLNNKDKRFIKTDLQGDLFLGYKKEECGVNWASSKQVVPFFESLGFNLVTQDKKTGLNKKSVEGPIIEAQKTLSDIAPIYLEYKGYEKLCSTYGQSFLDQINLVSKRIHTQFTQLMNTTRLSSGGKDKDTNQENINLQNIPSDKETRSCFVSGIDNSLIDCDYTGQEDFLFTEISREQNLIDFYNDPRKRDGHSYVAKMCFPLELAGVKEENVKKERPDLRFQAKSCKFCFHYGGQAITAARNLNIPIETANIVYNNYFKAFPGINNYFKQAKKEAWDNGYITISKITGHKFFIYEIDELKEEQKDFDTDFWDGYKKNKEEDSSLFHSYYKPKLKEFYSKKSKIERNALNYPRLYGAFNSNIK